ncbi:MAG: NAD-binding protein [Cyanobacteria bacterium J06642_2]
MKPHVIVCHLGRTGYKIYCLLRQQGVAVTGIHSQPVPSENDTVIVGDPQATETLLAAGLETAQTLVLASADDALNLAVLVRARLLNPRIRIINRLFNTSLGDRLDQTLPDHHTMSVADLSAPVFAFAALGNQAIGQLHLFQQTWPIHEEYIHDRHPWKGLPLSQLWADRDRMSIYYLPHSHHLDLVSAVLCNQSLQVGDRLIVAKRPMANASKQSWSRRFLTIAGSLRRFQAQSQASLGALFALAIAIIGATLLYVAVSSNTAIVDALYFSVGMITGAGGQEQVAEQASPWIKVFTALMMLVGAGIVGICYALLNDLVLGTRFRQIWDVARIPHQDHYVICGLGGIGIRVAQHLHDRGYEVVILERDHRCRFLSTARALKIPTIIGDASVPSVLKAANSSRAAALVAATSTDMANLEIALTAKGIAPQLPVVVRNHDPQFASMSQTVFKFASVLSPTELAAPSFAAAAVGGNIIGSGLMANHLWVALSIRLTENHPFCDHQIRETSRQADFVPLYLETSHRTIHGWELLDISPRGGDVLYLTMPASKLDYLWRTRPNPAASRSR